MPLNEITNVNLNDVTEKACCLMHICIMFFNAYMCNFISSLGIVTDREENLCRTQKKNLLKEVIDIKETF